MDELRDSKTNFCPHCSDSTSDQGRSVVNTPIAQWQALAYISRYVFNPVCPVAIPLKYESARGRRLVFRAK